MITYLKPSLVVLIFFLCTNLFAQPSSTLKEGMKAPNFILLDVKGKTYKLSSFKSKFPVVIYFYPKAGTSGCTKQACGIRDNIQMFKEKNIIVLGVSVDSKDEISKFVSEHELNFPLLSDRSKIVSKKYGVLRDDGKAKRVTFIIDKNGIIARIIDVTDIDQHAKEVFDIASKL